MSCVPTVEDFISHIGKAVTPKGQHRVLTLISVDKIDRPGRQPTTRTPFILILRGPPDDLLREGLYDVTLAGGPDVTLYLMPVHTVARDRQDYQVVFN